jgi:hypothetical protein
MLDVSCRLRLERLMSIDRWGICPQLLYDLEKAGGDTRGEKLGEL